MTKRSNYRTLSARLAQLAIVLFKPVKNIVVKVFDGGVEIATEAIVRPITAAQAKGALRLALSLGSSTV
jgi:hypothetical protein